MTGGILICYSWVCLFSFRGVFVVKSSPVNDLPFNDPPLKGIRILDMTRVLAGPTATQILGDLGAEIIKLERPQKGDDSRSLGPPYLKNGDASAYFISANRNKKSLALNLTVPEGQKIARSLASKCDAVIENFRAGTLKRYKMDYQSLHKLNPKLVYCSVTGFGQTGPYKGRGGYDFLVQAMGGIMSVTGFADTPPTKVGVGISDIVTGLYTAIAVLSALRVAEQTGKGQHIDMALLDCQLSWLSYIGQGYLLTERIPRRIGNQHPSIVPYQVFMASDGPWVLAVANDEQFNRFCEFAKLTLHKDPRFSTNEKRVKNRHSLVPLLNEVIIKKPVSHWVDGLVKINVPSGPINDLGGAFADPQIKARKLVRTMKYRHKDGTKADLKVLASPLNLPQSPVQYKLAPPKLGEHTAEILAELLALTPSQIARLDKAKIVETYKKK